jgi:hypothetical protein
VKIPLPSGRSFGGNARATIRIAAGQFADSAIPSSSRNTSSAAKLPDNDVRPATTDHANTASPNAQRRCDRSSSIPTANCANV